MSLVTLCDACGGMGMPNGGGWGSYRLPAGLTVRGQGELDLCPACCAAIERMLKARSTAQRAPAATR